MLKHAGNVCSPPTTASGMRCVHTMSYTGDAAGSTRATFRAIAAPQGLTCIALHFIQLERASFLELNGILRATAISGRPNRAQGKQGPNRLRSPHHPSNFVPSFSEFSGEQYLAGVLRRPWRGGARRPRRPTRGGLHSSTFQLNLSRF